MSVTEATGKGNVQKDEIEIRLSDIYSFFRKSKKTVIIGSIIGLVIGLLVAFFKADQYTSQVTVMPEIQPKGSGMAGLSGLAGLAGLDLGGGAGGAIDAIRPDIYPDILQSVPFALYILKKPVYSRFLNKETSLQEFLVEHSNQSFLGIFFGYSDKDGQLLDPDNRSKTLQITKEQERLVKAIHSSILATFDKKSGMITVSATFPDPLVSATIARLALDYLTDYVTSYRTEKTRNQVRFLTRQVAESKSRYQQAEYALSNYRDRNRNLFLETAKIEEQRLQADFLLTQSVFSDLSKQLEQAKIKVLEDSPVFKILEPARIPLRKSAPKRSLIIVGFVLVGALLAEVIFGIRYFFFINAEKTR